MIAPAERSPRFEIELLPGLDRFVAAELHRRVGQRAVVEGVQREGRLSIRFAGDPAELEGLRTAVAVHEVLIFPVPRPRALLGDQYLRTLLAVLNRVIRSRPPGGFATFRLSAAGANSPVFTRLRAEIARGTGLRETEGAADLAIAARPSGRPEPGWEVLVRTTPRPLAARAWRVCDMPGALNATAAAVLAGLAGTSGRDRFVNVACGSGTLLVERLAVGRPRDAVGLDTDPAALDCAAANLTAANMRNRVLLIRTEASNLPLPTGYATHVVADLPYGMLMGSAKSNAELYPALLREAGRVVVPGGALVAITTNLRRFEDALGQARTWEVVEVIPVKIPFKSGYFTPRIFRLRRLAA